MLSIRTRFILVTLLSVTLALSLAAWFFIGLFAANLERRIDTELTSHLNFLAGTLGFAPDGRLIQPDSPKDNRFFKAYGGLYWQIVDPSTSSELRSPSLFDYALPLPADAHVPGSVHRYRLKGPEGRDVIVQERDLIVAAPDGSREIRIAVAIDAATLDDARSEFAITILPYVAALALFLVAMSVLQLSFGLKPLATIAADLNAVREKRATFLPGPYPGELTELVRQLNQLLETQGRTIERARARASDLAHGLKTPLTVISNNAQRLEEKGETEIASELDMLAQSMLAHVNHELARTRIAQSPDQRRSDASPAKICGEIVRTLKRTEQGERLAWSIEIPESLTLPIDPHDLREMIGNLLENAAKWARSSVSVTGIRTGGDWLLSIDDDGPGVDETRIPDLTRRGVRLDHQTPGSGLGLAIVREIAEVYRLTLTFENRPQGGLRASVLFPHETT